MAARRRDAFPRKTTGGASRCSAAVRRARHRIWFLSGSSCWPSGSCRKGDPLYSPLGSSRARGYWRARRAAESPAIGALPPLPPVWARGTRGHRSLDSDAIGPDNPIRMPRTTDAVCAENRPRLVRGGVTVARADIPRFDSFSAFRCRFRSLRGSPPDCRRLSFAARRQPQARNRRSRNHRSVRSDRLQAG